MLHFPDDLAERSFLDVGANDGLFSFIAEKKGAKRIISSDLYKEDVGSMEMGWSYKGITMLKEFFKSKIQIHKGGIYKLNELNEKFDVVLVNHVINWLDNIELAIEQLAGACKGELFISDGFILESNASDRIKPQGLPIQFMYKVSYISGLLEKHGMVVENVKEINYERLFMHYFLDYPRITVKSGTNVYEYPGKDSPVKAYVKDTELYAFGRSGDYYQLFEIGWFHKDEVQVYYHQPSLYFKLLRSVKMESIYYAIKGIINKRKKGYTSYVIKARKK